MIKKIKRYIINLNYKKSLHISVSIGLIVELISICFIISGWKILLFRSGIYDLVEWILLSLIVLPTLSGFIFFLLLGGPFKKSSEEYEKKVEEAKKTFTNFDNQTENIPKNTQEYFPKEIILFYLAQKGTQFWLETKESEESNDVNCKIYITDKDNPDKKIEYPEEITNLIYLNSHFELKN